MGCMRQLTDNVYRNIRLRGKHAEVGSHHSFHGPADNQLQCDPCSGASLHKHSSHPLQSLTPLACLQTISCFLARAGCHKSTCLDGLANPLLFAYTSTLAACRVSDLTLLAATSSIRLRARLSLLCIITLHLSCPFIRSHCGAC